MSDPNDSQLITLRTAFPNIFVTEKAIDAKTLRRMVDFGDSYNHGHYEEITDAVLDGKYEKAEDEKGYKLYARKDTIATDDTEEGKGKARQKTQWVEVTNSKTPIPSSVELYLKKADATSPKGEEKDEDFVQIYGLKRLKADYLAGKEPAFPWFDKVQLVTAVVYALCCYDQKLAQLQIRDMEIVNQEQREINRVLMRLTSFQKEMNDLNGTNTNYEARPQRPPDQDIYLFFLERGLLTKDLVCGICEPDEIQSMRTKIFGTPENPGTRSRFKQWTHFLSFLNHGDLFAGWQWKDEHSVALEVVDQRNILLAEQAAASNSTVKRVTAADAENLFNLNFFDPIYWKKTASLENNLFPATAGLGEHFAFDPRLRDKKGNILNKNWKQWDGKKIEDLALVPGFHLLKEQFVRKGTDKEAETRRAEKTYVDYSVRSFSEKPPANKDEWLREVATSLQKNKFLCEDNNSQTSIFVKKGDFYEFSAMFLARLETENEARRYKYVKFEKDSNSDEAFLTLKLNATKSKTDDDNQTGEYALDDLKTAAKKEFYWAVPWRIESDDKDGNKKTDFGNNAWNSFIESVIQDKLSKLQLYPEQVAIWTDTLRIYADRKTSDNSLKSSDLQRTIQEAEKDFTLSSNLDKAIYRNKQGALANVR